MKKRGLIKKYFLNNMIFQINTLNLCQLRCSLHKNVQPVILLHGGATRTTDDNVAAKRVEGVEVAARKGYEILTSNSGTVADAVEVAVQSMESNELFNAGRGSFLNLEGEVEMDASIMVGSNLAAGAVKNIEHPVSLARLVMEKTTHVLLAGEGANKFAEDQGVPILPPGSLITDKTRVDLERVKQQLAEAQRGCTVGAVAIDSQGRLAAATSSGGTEGKMVGRSSATCMFGCGTYADDNIGAVSTTGHGESISKFCLAHAIIKAMEIGKTAQDATDDCITEMTKRLNNTAGAITISKSGDVGISFSTSRMPWAYIKGNEIHSGIDRHEHNINMLNSV